MLESQFNHFYQKYHSDLFHFLFYMVKSREQAEDLVQEVYIRVLKAYNQFEGRSSEKVWLFSIARNVAIDFFRKQKRWRDRITGITNSSINEIPDDNGIPEEIALEREEMQEVYACLQRYNMEQRMVIVFRYFQRLSIAETAEVLGWSVSKVKTVQHRTIKKLAKDIQEKEKHSRYVSNM